MSRGQFPRTVFYAIYHAMKGHLSYRDAFFGILKYPLERGFTVLSFIIHLSPWPDKIY